MSTSARTPDGTSPATDRRGLRVLDLEECLSRIGHAVLGRVAFLCDGDVVVLPVNHLVDGTRVAFRTTWGSKLQLAADGSRVAFEIDGHDPELATGWSVLVQGVAHLVDDAETSQRLDERAAEPWVRLDTPSYWVDIRPDSISGREIIAPAPG